MSAQKRKRNTSCAAKCKSARHSGAFCDSTVHDISERLERLSIAPATQAVLSTYELLEAILLRPSIRDLFVLQRVSKKWQDIIAQSHALQKRMFLRPLEDSVHKTCAFPRDNRPGLFDYAYATDIKLNPAMAVAFEHYYCGSEEEPVLTNPFQAETAQYFGYWYGIDKRQSKHSSFALMRPNFTKKDTVKVEIIIAKYDSQRAPVRSSDDLDDNPASYQPPLRKARGVDRVEASWRRMLVAQPPVYAVEVGFGLGKVDLGTEKVLNPEGLRSSDLEDACDAFLDRPGQKAKKRWYTLRMSFKDEDGNSSLQRAYNACLGRCRGKEACACLQMLEDD